MPTRKRARIQAYLEPELAEIIRRRAEEEDRPESREVTRLVQLGLEADAKCYALGGRVFRTKADIGLYIFSIQESLQVGEVTSDPVLLEIMCVHPEWDTLQAQGSQLVLCTTFKNGARCIAYTHKEQLTPVPWTKLLDLINKTSLL